MLHIIISGYPVGGTTHTHSYDPLNRLTKDARMDTGARRIQWGFDAASELSSLKTITGSTTAKNLTLAYDAAVAGYHYRGGQTSR